MNYWHAHICQIIFWLFVFVVKGKATKERKSKQRDWEGWGRRIRLNLSIFRGIIEICIRGICNYDDSIGVVFFFMQTRDSCYLISLWIIQEVNQKPLLCSISLSMINSDRSKCDMSHPCWLYSTSTTVSIPSSPSTFHITLSIRNRYHQTPPGHLW